MLELIVPLRCVSSVRRSVNPRCILLKVTGNMKLQALLLLGLSEVSESDSWRYIFDCVGGQESNRESWTTSCWPLCIGKTLMSVCD